MQAKFEKILLPIADTLIDEAQRKHVTFDAFFSNVMFHEVAHGLGIKNTINGRGTVREALLDVASSMEEGKADVLGLYMVIELLNAGELGDADIMDYYVTFMAGIFRSIRFASLDSAPRSRCRSPDLPPPDSIATSHVVSSVSSNIVVAWRVEFVLKKNCSVTTTAKPSPSYWTRLPRGYPPIARGSVWTPSPRTVNSIRSIPDGDATVKRAFPLRPDTR